MPNRRIKSGTCHFTSVRAAIRFYRSYGLSEGYVLQKLTDGEIFIGEPLVTGNERAVLVDNNTRWAIESDAPITPEEPSCSSPESQQP